ncbi:hypothetical protein LA080_012816 [Diaporthe eres]|nr:hypothetical protein LA080_012816 [Diaporthe eres]
MKFSQLQYRNFASSSVGSLIHCTVPLDDDDTEQDLGGAGLYPDWRSSEPYRWSRACGQTRARDIPEVQAQRFHRCSSPGKMPSRALCVVGRPSVRVSRSKFWSLGLVRANGLLEGDSDASVATGPAVSIDLLSTGAGMLDVSVALASSTAISAF